MPEEQQQGRDADVAAPVHELGAHLLQAGGRGGQLGGHDLEADVVDGEDVSAGAIEADRGLGDLLDALQLFGRPLLARVGLVAGIVDVIDQDGDRQAFEASGGLEWSGAPFC